MKILLELGLLKYFLILIIAGQNSVSNWLAYTQATLRCLYKKVSVLYDYYQIKC